MTFPVNIPLQFFLSLTVSFHSFPRVFPFPSQTSLHSQTVYIIKLMNMSENIIRENIYGKSFHNLTSGVQQGSKKENK